MIKFILKKEIILLRNNMIESLLNIFLYENFLTSDLLAIFSTNYLNKFIIVIVILIFLIKII